MAAHAAVLEDGLDVALETLQFAAAGRPAGDVSLSRSGAAGDGDSDADGDGDGDGNGDIICCERFINSST